MKGLQIISIAVLSMVLIAGLVGCSVPERQDIEADFKALFAREAGEGLTPVVLRVGSGEGDGSSVYEYIDFDVVVDKDVKPTAGWFAGMELKQGQRLYGGRMEILYQKETVGSEWKMSRHNSVERLPALEEEKSTAKPSK